MRSISYKVSMAQELSAHLPNRRKEVQTSDHRTFLNVFIDKNGGNLLIQLNISSHKN
jgi:hypothetical protein